jgi:hypothetical protein
MSASLYFIYVLYFPATIVPGTVVKTYTFVQIWGTHALGTFLLTFFSLHGLITIMEISNINGIDRIWNYKYNLTHIGEAFTYIAV